MTISVQTAAPLFVIEIVDNAVSPSCTVASATETTEASEAPEATKAADCSASAATSTFFIVIGDGTVLPSSTCTTVSADVSAETTSGAAHTTHWLTPRMMATKAPTAREGDDAAKARMSIISLPPLYENAARYGIRVVIQLP